MVADVSEFVREHAPQLILGEELANPGGHRDRGVLRIAARRKGVRLLLRDHVELRHGETGASGQVPDHLVEPRILLLGHRLRLRGSESNLVAEEPAAHVDDDRDEQEDQGGRRPADQVTGADQDAAEDREQQNRLEGRLPVGTSGGCHLGKISFSVSGGEV